jgi:hypothetical protein
MVSRLAPPPILMSYRAEGAFESVTLEPDRPTDRAEVFRVQPQLGSAPTNPQPDGTSAGLSSRFGRPLSRLLHLAYDGRLA